MKIDYERVYDRISRQWDEFTKKNGVSSDMKWVVAISGGKDSTVVAALAQRKFGKEWVVGVTLPCDIQKDFDDSKRVIEFLGIQHVNINIGDSVYGILQGIENNALEVSYDARTNLPARVRTAATFAVAQSVGGMVLNTCNLTESILGYCTLFGDDCGSFAPIKNLTVTEVIELGDWLGLPSRLTHKTPIDGLQPLTDEEKLGMKYADVDNYIRNAVGTPELIYKVRDMYRRNKFKTDIVNVPGPSFDFPIFT